MADDLNPGFNLGDLVQLKSGGPIMTVERFLNGRTEAVWFAYGRHHACFFEPRALKAVDGVEERTAAVTS